MHESIGSRGIFSMPSGCPAGGENGAFESNAYYGSASFHSKYCCIINDFSSDYNRKDEGSGKFCKGVEI